MSGIFNNWCKTQAHSVAGHRLQMLTEDAGKRAAVLPALDSAIKAHYDEPTRLAQRIQQWGFAAAARAFNQRLPLINKAQSGHMGEILLTEAVAELVPPFVVPIKRLRWLDGRNMALRGEDLIGVTQHSGSVRFLKAESKSRIALSASVVGEARTALNHHDGRPSVHSMLFVADRLYELGQEALARIFDEYAHRRDLSGAQLVHLTFGLSANDSAQLFTNDLQNCGNEIEQQAIGLVIQDHADFIKGVYDRLSNATQP